MRGAGVALRDSQTGMKMDWIMSSLSEGLRAFGLPSVCIRPGRRAPEGLPACLPPAPKAAGADCPGAAGIGLLMYARPNRLYTFRDTARRRRETFRLARFCPRFFLPPCSENFQPHARCVMAERQQHSSVVSDIIFRGKQHVRGSKRDGAVERSRRKARGGKEIRAAKGRRVEGGLHHVSGRVSVETVAFFAVPYLP